MKKEFLLNLKENDFFKLFADSPLFWRVIEYRPACYSHSLRAVCVNSPKHITAPFSYDISVFVYECN